MANSLISEETLPFPDVVVQAVTAHARRHADLVGRFLPTCTLIDGKPIRLPAAALLELAAVLQLTVWEEKGLRPLLDVDLPTSQEAMQQFVDRCTKGSVEFNGPHAAPFSLKILRIWMEHFAWDGPELLQAELMVNEPDEDRFINLLAEFVWTYRNELKTFLDKGT